MSNGKKQVVDLTQLGDPAFLMKKGLPRDKALYVTLMLRMRADVRGVARVVSDPDVLEALDFIDGYMDEDIKMMYGFHDLDTGTFSGVGKIAGMGNEDEDRGDDEPPSAA